ncbi:prolyl-tRNA synthetase associated domain-containing protein [Methyloceanibacter sp.]|uniref:prolyl-tRNA synthetase associated domain-containing protein n=1 Tax=Methyloceanibacter sp. TaxID=1965321 RepID=UPI00208CE092|nr:prolyl-tRNA synthetase associated domain-containing protein [Methyloceanibacter sp.]GFO81462.1 MAG: prolyl-tRNA editing protein [Methyloceanibacter sp.]HML91566.1 prolyl-tRNA synthetase associated domain-containing protein [Methyloceanibacter sp.]
MELARTKLFARLEELGIASDTVEHEAMFTVEQSQALRGRIPGAHTKNLFLRDKDDRLVLVVAKEDTTVDLKALAKTLGLGRFSFGKPEQMMAVLGVEPGSVTALALIHEGSRALAAVVVDEALMAFSEVNCHPLVNRATTRLATGDLLRFMRACGHEPLVLPLQ